MCLGCRTSGSFELMVDILEFSFNIEKIWLVISNSFLQCKQHMSIGASCDWFIQDALNCLSICSFHNFANFLYRAIIFIRKKSIAQCWDISMALMFIVIYYKCLKFNNSLPKLLNSKPFENDEILSFQNKFFGQSFRLLGYCHPT